MEHEDASRSEQRRRRIVGTVTGVRLDYRGTTVRFPAGARFSPFLPSVSPDTSSCRYSCQLNPASAVVKNAWTHTSILHVPSQCAKGRLTFNCTLTVRSTFTFTLSQINLFHLKTFHFNTSICPVVSVRTARSNTGHSALPHTDSLCVSQAYDNETAYISLFTVK
jgi:hypothetical protein